MSDGSGMNTCGTCRHWDNPWGTTSTPFPFLREYPVVPDEADTTWGVCAFIGHPSEDASSKSPRAFTADGSDYWSSLSTRSDFGCVEWGAA
jgi:hypothetical protein